MIESFRSVIDFLTSLSQFAIHTLQSLWNLINHIPTFVSFLSVSVGLLPSIIIPFAIASISIYGVLIILNRE